MYHSICSTLTSNFRRTEALPVQRMKIPHDATLNIPGLEKHGRRQGPSLLSPSATGTREHDQHPSLQTEGPALRHQHRPYSHRVGSSPSTQTTRQAGGGGEMASILSRPFLPPPASCACHPASPPVCSKFTGTWVSSTGLVSSSLPYPQFPICG